MDLNIPETLSKPWKKFLIKVKEYDKDPIDEWKEFHLLGYFIFRFQSHYQHAYALTFQGPPSKCTEIVLIKKVMAAINLPPTFVKNYIDWIFECNLIPKKTQIRSISFLLTKGLANDYLALLQKNQRITKTTVIPEKFKQIILDSGLPINNYGDLAFAKKAVDEAPEAKSRLPYKELLEQLYNLGLKPESLESI